MKGYLSHQTRDKDNTNKHAYKLSPHEKYLRTQKLY